MGLAVVHGLSPANEARYYRGEHVGTGHFLGDLPA